MHQYKIYSLDHSGRIAFAHDVQCRDDLDALAQGEKEAAQHRVEVWEGARLVARVKLGNAPLNAADKQSL